MEIGVYDVYSVYKRVVLERFFCKQGQNRKHRVYRAKLLETKGLVVKMGYGKRCAGIVQLVMGKFPLRGSMYNVIT